MGGTTSIILVLLAGNSLGALVKGITGFGSAIINLCIWIAATCAGFNSGTLQQAVLTECIASEVLAIPLLIMTQAHATCDWALVLSLSLFGAVGAPLGAAMLTHLPSRQVEFTVGCLMLLVVIFNCIHKKDAQQEGPQEAKQCVAVDSEADGAADQPGSGTAGKLSQRCSLSLRQSACLGIELAAANFTGLPPAAERPTPVQMLPAPWLADEAATPVIHRSCSNTSTGSSTGDSSSLVSEAQCICIISSPKHDWDVSADEQEHTALLPPAAKAQQVHIQADEQMQLAGMQTCSPTATRGFWQEVVCVWWAAFTQPDRLAALRRMLLMGSLAGSASGVMAGLTGIGGPPVMLMFERLKVTKEVVRGTNAVCNVVNIRIFAYIAMGMFSRADLVLYMAVSVGAVVGMLLGCLVAAYTNQAMFSRLLTTLMVMCCALMFSSAAGIAGNNRPEQHGSS